jgi:hypothetical protein
MTAKRPQFDGNVRPMKNVTVRIPDDLHTLIEKAAETDRRSFNAEILWLAEQGLQRQPGTGQPAPATGDGAP